MQIRPLAIEGAWEITPRQFRDDRGVFLESFRADASPSTSATRCRSGRPTPRSPRAARSAGSTSPTSRRHRPSTSARWPARSLDFVVDLRTGSPTFGQWDSVLLDTRDRRAVYLSEGLGHAICALEDDSTVTYLCSSVYSPGREHGVHPLDPELGLVFPDGLQPLLSPKDAAAPTLAQAGEQGLLPRYDDCLALRAELAGHA